MCLQPRTGHAANHAPSLSLSEAARLPLSRHLILSNVPLHFPRIKAAYNQSPFAKPRIVLDWQDMYSSTTFYEISNVGLFALKVDSE